MIDGPYMISYYIQGNIYDNVYFIIVLVCLLRICMYHTKNRRFYLNASATPGLCGGWTACRSMYYVCKMYILICTDNNKYICRRKNSPFTERFSFETVRLLGPDEDKSIVACKSMNPSLKK